MAAFALALLALFAPPSVQAGQAASAEDQLAWGDFDADGLPDVLVVRPGEALRLLRNLGNGSFADVSAATGLDQVERPIQGLWQDVDGDRDLDLLVLSRRGPSLHVNQAGTFRDATASAGLEGLEGARAAAWRDFDLDGRPDLQLATNRGAQLLHNVGGAAFERVEPGLPAREEPARGVLAPSSDASTLSATAGAGLGGASSTPPRAAAAALGICAGSLFDTALGGCLGASTVPALGMLMPLSVDFNLDLAGNVGIGTTTPTAKLDVVGDVQASGKLVSTTTSGAPLAVASTIKVADLNADLLDGLDASAFSQLGGSIEGAEITNGTITAADLANGAVGSAQLASKAVASGNLATGAVTSIALATGAVDTTKLADGTILDADVSSLAAIAGTKVVPDFGSQVVTTLGTLGAGTPVPQATILAANASLGLSGVALFSEDLIVESAEAALGLFSDGQGQFGSALSLKEVQGGVYADAWSLVRETAGSGADLRFTYGASDTPYLNASRLVLQSDGDLGVGTTAPDVRLQVQGGSDVTPAGGGELQLGSSSGPNLALDGNEIMARDNGAAAKLNINPEGGDVVLGANSTSARLGVGISSPLGRLHVVDAIGGDGSVRLPTGSISRVELADEPGLASDLETSLTIVTDTDKVISTCTLDAPSDGYVLVSASALLYNQVGVGVSSQVNCFVEDLTAGTSSSSHYAAVPWNTFITLELHQVFPVTAGSRTFRLWAGHFSISPDVQCSRARLTAVFVPSAYGAVE